MDKQELAEILDKHVKWLRGEDGGSRADLSGAYLSRADLSGAYLSRADLSRADLSRADLSGAYLSCVDLSGADLSRADLSYNRYVIGCTLTNYPMVAFMHQNNLFFTSGCRRGLTLEEARTYWSPDNKDKWTKKDNAWGEQRLRQIDFLEAEAKHLGWIK